jgi:hypothetical protein
VLTPALPPACTCPCPATQEEWRGEIEQLSWKPRAFLAKGFLSDEECEHIKDIVRAELRVVQDGRGCRTGGVWV